MASIAVISAVIRVAILNRKPGLPATLTATVLAAEELNASGLAAVNLAALE